MDLIKWRTKDGREIPLRDMTDAHLLNTIHMLRRRATDPHGKYSLSGNYAWKVLNRERRRRGLCGIHTGDCIYASKSDTEDHSFLSRACYAKQLEAREKARNKAMEKARNKARESVPTLPGNWTDRIVRDLVDWTDRVVRDLEDHGDRDEERDRE